jgi:glycosyltransferase involved in cell wall biosynthesis
MKYKVLFIERKQSESVSIERVFEQIAKDLPEGRYEIARKAMPYGNGVFGIFLNLLFFKPDAADLYHITGHVHYAALRLPKKKTVLTIHDLVFIHRRSGLRRAVLKWLFLKLPLRNVTLITTVSRSTKEEILKYNFVDEQKVRVIENPMIGGFEPRDEKPFDEDCPVILQIGTAQNKNLINLIRALNGVKCKLRIIGRLDANISETLDSCGIQYEDAFGLNQNEIAGEYRMADIVAFCSTYEGFGLPIIEAQAMKKPVITSDRPPMNDVAGRGACLVDPDDVSSIRSGLLKIINNREYRTDLIEQGKNNVLRFDGKKIAAQYADLYDDILICRS